ncbi:MAG: hypothetical protein NZ519_04875 [Bacteroidia bacterium]|nr:hypothetical protein [Bacteroidia bacterium]
MGVSLRLCPQGQRARGYVRNATTLASARCNPKKSNPKYQNLFAQIISITLKI